MQSFKGGLCSFNLEEFKKGDKKKIPFDAKNSNASGVRHSFASIIAGALAKFGVGDRIWENSNFSPHMNSPNSPNQTVIKFSLHLIAHQNITEASKSMNAKYMFHSSHIASIGSKLGLRERDG